MRMIKSKVRPQKFTVFDDVDSIKLLMTLGGHGDDVNSVAISPDGRYIVSGSRDRTVRIWDINSGDLLRTLGGHEWGGVNSVAISPDSRYIVSGGGRVLIDPFTDSAVQIWDINSGDLLMTLEGHEESVRSVAISPDGRYIVSGDGKTVRIWDINSGDLLMTLEGHKGGVNSVAISPDGRYIVSGGGAFDNTVRIWGIE